MQLYNNFTLYALMAGLTTWLLTTIGSSMVLFVKKVNKNFLDASLSIASGIMISASFWSLLKPATETAESLNQTTWLILSLGFLFGSIFILIFDRFYKIKNKNIDNKENRLKLLILSITMHNIPEGLAIGIAFGSIKYGIVGATLTSAILLSLAIGLQNMPEGCAISLPLRREGYSRKKSFIIGSMSAIVEPVSAVLGALLTLKVQTLMPFLLSFAAGAMIFVVVQELIPESQMNKNNSIMSLLVIVGFVIMMILDTAL